MSRATKMIMHMCAHLNNNNDDGERLPLDNAVLFIPHQRRAMEPGNELMQLTRAHCSTDDNNTETTDMNDT